MKRGIAVFGIFGGLLAASAAAAQEGWVVAGPPPPPPSPPPTAEALAAPLRPDWLRMPTDEQLANIAPARLRKGAEVTVKLRCFALATGRLERCNVVEGAPSPRGFADAAVLAATRYYQMRPRSRDNVPVAGREVYLDVVWKYTPPRL